MHSTAWNSAKQELEKIALTRWQQALQSGEITPEEMARMTPGVSPSALQGVANLPAEGGMSPKVLAALSPSSEPPSAEQAMVNKTLGTVPGGGSVPMGDMQSLTEARNKMWGPGAGELNPEQLARHRDLQEMMGRRNLKELGGWNINHPTMGPATMANKVMVNPLAGTLLRDMSEGKIHNQGEMLRYNMPGPVEKLRQAGNYIQQSPMLKKHLGGLGLHNLPEPVQQQPVDKTLYNAVVQHEGGEKAMMRGALEQGYKGRKGLMGGTHPELAVPARPIASHLGATPVLEEKQVTWRDPQAQQIFGKVRQSEPDSRYIEALHRQYGGRPDMPVPLGGKQHAGMERAVAMHTPQTEMALKNRLLLAGQGTGHGADISKHLQPVQDLVQKTIQGPHEFEVPGLGKTKFELPGLAQKGTNFVRNLAGKINVHPADPANLGSRLMGLRSLVRR